MTTRLRLRPALLAPVVALLACVALVGGPTPALAARGPDRAMSAAVREARRGLLVAGKEAQGTLRSATRNFTAGLRAGTQTPAEVGSGYGAALAFFVRSLELAARKAAREAGDGVSARLAELGDEEDGDGLAGAGGVLDQFAALVERDLERLRRQAQRSTARFLTTVERLGGSNVHGGFRILPLPPPILPAPTADGTLDPADRPLAVRCWFLVRTRETGVVITVAGAAPEALEGAFDVRLVRDGHVTVGDALSEGGVTVDADGWWTVTDIVGAPGGPLGYPAGNRALRLGVDPEDNQISGLQPTRFVDADVVGIPD